MAHFSRFSVAKSIAVGLAIYVLAFALNTYAHESSSVFSNPQEQPSTQKPQQLEGVGLKENLGSKIDLNLTFHDESGKTVRLGDFFDGRRPVILSPVYFSCPGLCNFHLNGLTDGLKELEWTAGENFQLVSLSFDPKEKSELASKKKETYLRLYGRPQASEGWHFLTGDQEQITALTQALGFSYRWNEEAKEWAHTSAAVVITPNGTISRYLPGITFEKKDLKLALVEAGEGRVGTIADRLAMFCFKYDPHQSKYTLYAYRLMQIGGGLMVLILALWILPALVRGRKV